MQEGWGNYLRKIDVLKDKVAQKKKLNLNDACSVLYLEGHCSYHWQHFKEDCIKTGVTLPQNWEGWHQMFQNSLKYCEWAK